MSPEGNPPRRGGRGRGGRGLGSSKHGSGENHTQDINRLPTTAFAHVKEDRIANTVYVTLIAVETVGASIFVDEFRTVDFDDNRKVIGVEFAEFDWKRETVDTLPIEEDDKHKIHSYLGEYKASKRKTSTPKA